MKDQVKAFEKLSKLKAGALFMNTGQAIKTSNACKKNFKINKLFC